MKRFFERLFLLTIICVSLSALLAFSVTAESYSGSCGTSAKWSLDTETGVLTVSGSGSITLSPWASRGSEVKSIVVGNGITSISNGVFKSCVNLEEISLPFIGKSKTASGYEGVLGSIFGYTVGDEYELVGILKTTFPVQYVKVERYSYAVTPEYSDYFDMCTEYSYNIPTTLKKVTVTGGTVRGMNNCIYLKEVVIGGSVTAVAGDAFTNCPAISSISISDKSMAISANAFKDTAYYKDQNNWTNGVLYIDNHLIKAENTVSGVLELKASTVCIAEKAFLNCTEISEVIMPSTVISVNASAFAGCTGIKEMTVSFAGSYVPQSVEKVTVIGGSVFNNVFQGYPNLTEVVLLDGVTSIGSCAFKDCPKLSLITIPASVTAIGNEVFNSSLTICGVVGSVAEDYANSNNIPFVTCVHSFGEWVTDGENTYRQCIKCSTVENSVETGNCGVGLTWTLNRVSKQLSITGVGAMTDYSQESPAPWIKLSSYIKNVVISNEVTTIGANAFDNCSMLETVTVPETVCLIESGVFDDCVNVTIKGYINSYAEDYCIRRSIAFSELDIADLKGNAQNVYWNYYEDLGRLVVYGEGALTGFSEWSDIADDVTSIAVRDGITAIKRGTFRDFVNLKEITLPFVGDAIGAEAENGVFGVIFGWECFYDGTGEDLKDPDSIYQYSVDYYSEISGEWDYSYDYYYFIPHSLEKVTVTGTDIPERAFYNCPMNTIVLINADTIGTDAINNKKATVYGYVNSKAQKYASSNGISFVAFCDNESGHSCTSTVVAPTCKSGGYTYYVCNSCGYSYKSDYTDVLPHDYEKTVTAPTCTTTGYTTYVCSNCLHTYTGNNVPSLGHSYGEWVRVEGSTISECICSSCNAVVKRVSSGTHGDNVEWFIDLNTNTLYISGKGSMADCGMYEKSPWAAYKSSFDKVVVEQGITDLGLYAFHNQTNITSLTLPASVTKIDSYAVYNCTGLKELHVADLSVWCSIDFGAYEHSPLYYAGELYVGDELVTDLVIPSNITTVKAYSFLGCTSIKNLTIPDTVTAISDSSFYGCTSLENITFSKNMTAICDRAFYGCTSLEKVVIPENIKTISFAAFRNCSGLKRIVIPATVTSFGSSVFKDCTALTIYGYKGSKAESYAGNNNIAFVAMDVSCEKHSFGNWSIVTEATCTESGTKTRSCEVCGETETEMIPSIGHSFSEWTINEEEGIRTRKCHCGEIETEELPTEPSTKAVFTLSGGSATPGETVKLKLSLSSKTEINSIAISGFVYDSDLLEFVGFSDYEAINEMPVLTSVFDNEKEYILIGFTQSLVFDGEICTLEFKVKDSASDGIATISATTLVKLSSKVIDSEISKANIKVYTYVKGDIDGDDDVDLDDAVYLFGNSMLPEFYPTSYLGNMDFNRDGSVDIDDAILLFNYSMLPDIYPLS